jgi:hypothetical protein
MSNPQMTGAGLLVQQVERIAIAALIAAIAGDLDAGHACVLSIVVCSVEADVAEPAPDYGDVDTRCH